MKNFEISVLTANSRYLQTAALKFLSDNSGIKFANEIHVGHKEIVIINRCAKIYSRRNSTVRPVESYDRFARIPSKVIFTILLQVDVKR